MKKILLSLLFITTLQVQSQEPAIAWTGNIGGLYYDSSQGLHVDNNGFVYITGGYAGNVDFDMGTGSYVLNGASSSDAFLAKYNTNREIVWAVRFAGSLNSFGFGVATDSASNVYSAGTFNNTIDFDPGANTYNMTATTGGPYSIHDIYLSKLDSNGNFVYANKIGGLGVRDISHYSVDANGNTYMAGYFNKAAIFSPSLSFAATNGVNDSIYDMFIAKWDNAGNVLWAKQIGSGYITQRAEGIAIDPNGAVYICGQFHQVTDFDPSPTGSYTLTPHLVGASDIFVLKLDTDGNFIWARSMGGTSPSTANSIALDQTGAPTLTGSFTDTVDFDPSNNDYLLSTPAGSGFNPFLLKLTSNGELQWVKHFIGNGEGRAVTIKSNGDIGIIGTFNNTCDFSGGNGTAIKTTQGGSDIFIADFSNNGILHWVKSIGGSQWDTGVDIDKDPLGNYYAFGDFTGTASINTAVDNFSFTANGSQDIMLLKINNAVLENTDFGREALLAYPNPCEKELNLIIPNEFTNGQLFIYSITGQLLQQSKVKSSINIEDLASGSYILKITNDSSKILNQLFIKK